MKKSAATKISALATCSHRNIQPLPFLLHREGPRVFL
jgi:hypothetical protein